MDANKRQSCLVTYARRAVLLSLRASGDHKCKWNWYQTHLSVKILGTIWKKGRSIMLLPF